MKAKYTAIIKVEVTHDNLEHLKDIKSDREFATDLCNMICDEAVNAGAVATYKIYDSEVNVTLH